MYNKSSLVRVSDHFTLEGHSAVVSDTEDYNRLPAHRLGTAPSGLGCLSDKSFFDCEKYGQDVDLLMGGINFFGRKLFSCLEFYFLLSIPKYY